MATVPMTPGPSSWTTRPKGLTAITRAGCSSPTRSAKRRATSMRRRSVSAFFARRPASLQWCATAFLWSQWLIQDLANIFVYLPRELGFEFLIFAIAVMLLLHAVIFKRRGGEIQAIVTSKTNTTDIRAATIIDFTYALILLYFKEMSNMPMSTTWVFLGLLAGREMALSLLLKHRPVRDALVNAGKDVGKATLGLAVSVSRAIGLPALLSRGAEIETAEVTDGELPVPQASVVAAEPSRQSDTPE